MDTIKDPKVLIVSYNSCLANIGGPSGYLYNLKNSMLLNNTGNIDILVGFNHSKEKEKTTSKREKRNIFKRYYPEWLLMYSHKKGRFKKFDKLIKSVCIENYDIFHFHSTEDLFLFHCFYPDIFQKKITILTSHCPCLPADEKRETMIKDGRLMREVEVKYNYNKNIDRVAFSVANILHFPVLGSELIYEKLLSPGSNIRYLPTHCEKLDFKKDKKEFFLDHSIPDDKIVFSYVGRRTDIKGFDILTDTIQKISKINSDIFFIVAGAGEKLENFCNVIDIGWTDDPGSIINASDYVVAPNKQTYFDLGIIQALSLGKHVITTLTGGNVFFAEKMIDMSFVEPNSDSLANKILELAAVGKIMSEKNLDFYNEELALKSFSIDYKKFYSTIYSEYYTNVIR